MLRKRFINFKVLNKGRYHYHYACHSTRTQFTFTKYKIYFGLILLCNGGGHYTTNTPMHRSFWPRRRIMLICALHPHPPWNIGINA